MKKNPARRFILAATFATIAFAAYAAPQQPAPKDQPQKAVSEAPPQPVAPPKGPAPEAVLQTPLGFEVRLKEIAPTMQETSLQVVTLLKHKSKDQGGDAYIEAMQEFNDRQGGLVAALRERGDFAGELGETLLYTPPATANHILPTRVLFIGLGDEAQLSLDRLVLAGRIALREGARLGVTDISFAPALRDQGSTKIDVGDGDAAVVEGVMRAYATQKRLAAEKLGPLPSVTTFTVEAGPKYFDDAKAAMTKRIETVAKDISAHDATPLVKH